MVNAYEFKDGHLEGTEELKNLKNKTKQNRRSDVRKAKKLNFSG